jgi:hypothetical protein
MKKWLLPAAAAALTLAGGAAMAQPYGYYGGGGYYDGRAYGGYDGRYYRGAWRDSDRDGVPDRAEWGRDRDHDGRPDQWDRYDNRRDGRWRHRYGAYEHRPSYGYGYAPGYRW